MAQLQKVLPGDLITARDFNDLIDELIRLGGILDSLTIIQTDQVVITDLIPPSGTVQVGGQLTVIGRNFRFFAGGLKVYVGDTRVLTFGSATDEKLIFAIPTSITVS